MRFDNLALPSTEDSYGIVHGDVYQFNMVLDELMRPTLYDWELSCKYWYVADVGALLCKCGCRYALKNVLKAISEATNCHTRSLSGS